MSIIREVNKQVFLILSLCPLNSCWHKEIMRVLSRFQVEITKPGAMVSVSESFNITKVPVKCFVWYPSLADVSTVWLW